MRILCRLTALTGWLVILLANGSSALAQKGASKAAGPAEVLQTMERVADWQLANPSKHKTTDWTQGAFYAGLMALGDISGSSKYRDAMLAIGRTNEWKLGPMIYHADDHAVAQAYCELYEKYREPAMIAPLKERFDFILTHRDTNAIGSKVSPGPDKANPMRWWWCDALFMGPPAWARLYAVTGEQKYLDFMLQEWNATTDYLYDKQEHLYFRDNSYFEKREANGKKIFWSRGNGWVMGGLVRVLEYLPENHPVRAQFVQQFKEMADKLLTCQQEDGLWRSSLLDPASYPIKETSGSGFFTYAFAWGINQGLLDAAKFQPAVEKAWRALVDCVQPDGKLTHVQPIGADPKKFEENATEVYGVGAFLLAGSEVYRMDVFKLARGSVVTITNPGELRRESETIELKWPDVAQQFGNDRKVKVAVMNGVSSRIIDSQVIDLDSNTVPESIIFQVDLLPEQVRTVRLVPTKALAAVPPPIVKTFCRFVPERMDDFAWENDRIGYRMYGQALIKGEGTISSGIDVWVKRVRYPIINSWYKSGKYHEDHGEGLDCYKVGSSRGCGGLGIWDGKKLYTSSNFKVHRVLANGPIRCIFELTYEPWVAGDRKLAEFKLISLDAGSNLNHIESMLRAQDEKGELTVGIGIAKREGEGNFVKDPAGWMSYWEPEAPPNGSIGCAVVLKPGEPADFTEDNGNYLLITKAKPMEPLVYFAGAGWSKGGDFPIPNAWHSYVADFARRIRSPVKVQLGGK